VFDTSTTPTTEEPAMTDPQGTPDPHAVKSPGDDSPGASSAEKDNSNWVTGDEPMTGPQASYLETLAQQAGEEPPTGLNKSQASRAIDELRDKAGR
jgi:hypothetical protein